MNGLTGFPILSKGAHDALTFYGWRMVAEGVYARGGGSGQLTIEPRDPSIPYSPISWSHQADDGGSIGRGVSDLEYHLMIDARRHPLTPTEAT